MFPLNLSFLFLFIQTTQLLLGLNHYVVGVFRPFSHYVPPPMVHFRDGNFHISELPVVHLLLAPRALHNVHTVIYFIL